MKRLFLILTLSFIAANIISGNDAVFYASGGNLIPIKENTISIKKEILNLKRDGDYMDIQVYFEFFNPGEEKELTVGFITPPAGGDILEEEQQHPFVSDFMVVVDDKLLAYNIKKLDETGFTLPDGIANGVDFVYYFDVLFKKGVTKVNHAYRFKGGSSVMTEVDFTYRLTTAKMWAGGKIENFELNIDMGKNVYFDAPYTFNENGAAANWQIVGAGRKSPEPEKFIERSLLMVKILNGVLRLKAKDFSPDYDLSLSIFNTHVEVFHWNKEKDHVFTKMLPFLQFYYEPDEFDDFTKEELRLLKNYFFARKGYAFKSKDLFDYFSKFYWYIPDPNVNNNLSILSAKERKLVNDIVEVLKNR